MNYEKLEAEEREAEKLLNPEVVTPEKETEPEEKEELGKKEVVEPAEDDVAVIDETTHLKEDKTTVEKQKQEDEQTWKVKYDTLKGKYDKETPRAIREANQAKTEAQQFKDHAVKLQKQIDTLQSEVNTLKLTPKDTKELDELSITNPEVAALIRKRDEDHAKEIQALRDEFKQGVTVAVDPIQAELRESKEAIADRIIAADVPEWRELDRDERWHQWLEEKATPYADITKKDIMIKAATGWSDPQTLARLFKDFKKTLEASAEQDTPKKNLEKFVAPPKSTVATAPGKAGQPTYTWAQYNKFMADATKGIFDPKKWNDKTVEQIEGMFDKAILEGRVS